MKRVIVSLLAVALSAVIAMPVAHAQDPGAVPAQQLELASLLVNLMGLSRTLPAAPSAQQIFAALAVNGVSPEDGWDADKVVTKADLARTVVQAMGMASEIENPDDPNSWVAFLEAMGISIDTIGSAVSEIAPSPEIVAGNISRAGTTWDPLDNVSRFGEPDERDFGADMAMNASIGEPGPVPEPEPTPVEPPPPAVRRRPDPVPAVRLPVPRDVPPRVIPRIPVPTPDEVPVT